MNEIAPPRQLRRWGATLFDGTQMDSYLCDYRRTWSLGPVRTISAMGILRREHIGNALSGLPFLQITSSSEITGGDAKTFPTARRRFPVINPCLSGQLSVTGAARYFVLADSQSFHSFIRSRSAVVTYSVVGVLCSWLRLRCMVALARFQVTCAPTNRWTRAAIACFA